MKKGTILQVAAVSGAAVLLISTPPITASATHPGPNGRIAFQRWDEAGFAQIWTANPDLTAQQQLTHASANSGWAAWAPDTSRIAFDSDRSDPDPTDDVGVNDVFTMLPDGTHVTKVTDSVGFSGDPAFSPDGSLIAFDANRGMPDLSIYVIRPNGTGMRRVTTPPAGSFDTEPRFSPDGRILVFTRVQGQFTKSGRTARDISAVFTVNVDGTGLSRITGWGHKAGQADWSPNGRRIVFEMACCRLGAGGIFTVNADGTGFTALVNGHGITGIGNEQALQLDGYYDPVWSPDGARIIAGHEFLADDGTFTVGLVIVDPAKRSVDWVSSTVNAEHQPDWGTAPLH